MNKRKNAVGKRGKNQITTQKADNSVMQVFIEIAKQRDLPKITAGDKKAIRMCTEAGQLRMSMIELSKKRAKAVTEKGKRAGVYLINPFKGLHPTYKQEIRAKKERQKMRISGALNQHLSLLKIA